MLLSRARLAVRAVQASPLGTSSVLSRSVPSTRLTSTSHNTLARSVLPSTSVRAFSTVDKSIFTPADTFQRRHIGPTPEQQQKMLKVIGEDSLDGLIERTVPSVIRRGPMQEVLPQSESEALQALKNLASKNKIFRSHIGAGYYGTKTPTVILRNILENPGWYTPYTPYQAEIAQGRLEMLLNFQTMCQDLTGMEIANCSLLDEATAAAEAMTLCYNSAQKGQDTFFVSADAHPQTIAVVKTRARNVGITVRVGDLSKLELSSGEIFGVLAQYPATNGGIEDYEALAKKIHEANAKFVVASDLLALTILRPPGEFGADVVVGSAQRFGVPMGYGGPHAAFFACLDEHKRKMPGRVIGVSRDSAGAPALRMAMQTREQHIRRDKATSNICTAQALLANTAAAYGIYHGPKGLTEIAQKVHATAKLFATGASSLRGISVKTQNFFDTVHLVFDEAKAHDVIKAARKRNINLRHIDEHNIFVSFDETSTSFANVDDLLQVLAEATGQTTASAKDIVDKVEIQLDPVFQRTSPFMTHPIFNSYHCETSMLRYLYFLQSKDLSLQTAMIALGSCTMKLNATSEMIPITWPEFGGLHPFAPKGQADGYLTMIKELETQLADITGFHSVSMQPNSGAQGEYTGLMVIDAWQRNRGEGKRKVCLIPTSAHGTNPASAAMMGMQVVVVKCDAKGNIDMEDLKLKVEKHKDELSCLMITYPSTHGVFEETVKEITKLIHDNGGQVYMDGANLNAQIGLTSPGEMGADVCHLNLHKTFCIPHGGGGPGMGPIGVAEHLAEFLPGHPFDPRSVDTDCATGAIAAAPFSSASILPISYMYCKMMGSAGLRKATEVAILSANYMLARLSGHYPILYTGKNGTCAHEFILDIRPFKANSGVTEEDIAKRLQDFNFHAPTMSFPVAGTLMVEPTESEPLSELDRFCDAMLAIRKEISDIEEGRLSKADNPLKNAPHTHQAVISDKWDRAYSREQAAYPLPYLRTNKFWPSVGRLDNVYGDRNLICSCPPLDSYQ